MKISTKAALISAFVLPGAGHFFLKKYISGAVLFGTALSSLYYLITIAVEKALLIVEKIQNGDVQLDALSITELTSNQTTGTESQLVDIVTATLIICWLIGVIDSYRAGRVLDKK